MPEVDVLLLVCNPPYGCPARSLTGLHSRCNLCQKDAHTSCFPASAFVYFHGKVVSMRSVLRNRLTRSLGVIIFPEITGDKPVQRTTFFLFICSCHPSSATSLLITSTKRSKYANKIGVLVIKCPNDKTDKEESRVLFWSFMGEKKGEEELVKKRKSTKWSATYNNVCR